MLKLLSRISLAGTLLVVTIVLYFNGWPKNSVLLKRKAVAEETVTPETQKWERFKVIEDKARYKFAKVADKYLILDDKTGREYLYIYSNSGSTVIEVGD